MLGEAGVVFQPKQRYQGKRRELPIDLELTNMRKGTVDH